MIGGKFIFNIEQYLRNNSKDVSWCSYKYLPKKMAREYLILAHWGTWQNYEEYCKSIEEFFRKGDLDRFIDKLLYSKPKKMKLSVRQSKDVIDELDNKVVLLGWFNDYLFQLIEEKKMTEVEVYKNAHLDKRLFSKIRRDKYYKPSKRTVIAIAFAMELDLQETEDLLEHAGYSLSPLFKEDVIVKYFIENKLYDLFLLNEVLEHFGCYVVGD